MRAGFVAAFSVSAQELPAVGRRHRHRLGERLVIVAERAPGAGKAEPGPVVEAIRAAVSRRHAVPIADVRMVAAGAIPHHHQRQAGPAGVPRRVSGGVLGHRHPTD